VRRDRTFPALAALFAAACGGSVASDAAPPDGEAADSGARDASAPVDASLDVVAVEDGAVESAIDSGGATTDGGCNAITPTGSSAVAYQIDPGHSGGQPGDHLSLPLCQRWSVDLGGSVSYPLVAQGLVFVTVGSAVDAGGGVALVALDEHTGKTVWGPVALGGTVPMAHATYDDGHVLALDSDGQLSQLDATTGAPGWSVALSEGDAGDGGGGVGSFTSPPTALAGMVYVSGSLQTFGVNDDSGAVVWSAPMGTLHSAPAVSATGVYGAWGYLSDCAGAFDLAPATGEVLWQDGPIDCPGTPSVVPVVPTVALSGGDLCVSAFGYPFAGSFGDVLDATSGLGAGHFPVVRYDATNPALSGSTVFTFQAGTVTELLALPLGATTPSWTFTGDGQLASAPITVGPHVVVGSSLGNVFVVDATTGQQVGNAAVGAPIAAPDEVDDVVLTGLAAADGMLFVPAGSRLVAY
jgi:outer membrane protein assembly factor BamB